MELVNETSGSEWRPAEKIKVGESETVVKNDDK